MQLFRTSGGVLTSLERDSFKLERDIQSLVETNMDVLFGLQFVSTEFSIAEFRLDSLAFDEQNNSFVIVEYKKGHSYSVVDQGYSYLSVMLNNKAEFILEYNEQTGRQLKRSDIDWTSSRVIFVSPSFNSYQKDSVNFKNLPFELWEIKRFSNNTIVFNKHKSSSNESIESLTNTKNKNVISSVSREVKVFDDNDWISKTNEQLVQKWNDLKEGLIELNDIELVSKRDYISLMIGNKTICYFNFQKTRIRMDFVRGNIKPDGSKSKNFFTLDDPKQISIEGSWEWKNGTKGNVYKVSLDKNFDVDYVKFLIKQKYNNLSR